MADIDNDLAYMMQELDTDGDGCITFQVIYDFIYLYVICVCIRVLYMYVLT